MGWDSQFEDLTNRDTLLRLSTDDLTALLPAQAAVHMILIGDLLKAGILR